MTKGRQIWPPPRATKGPATPLPRFDLWFWRYIYIVCLFICFPLVFFLICLLPYLSFLLRIDPLRFQAGCPKRGFIFCCLFCIVVPFFCLVNACFCCVKLSFFLAKPRDWLGETSPKWPFLCLVGRKTTTQSIDQSINHYFSQAFNVCWFFLCFSRCFSTWLTFVMHLWSRLSYGLITIAIRARFEYDSTTIRLRCGYNTLQHATRFFVRSHTRSYTRISGRRVLHVDWQLNAHNFYFILT